MNKIGFNNDKYLKLQSENIAKRIKQFSGKLYLEFGGKLFDDYHASRVLPGFMPNSKMQMLLKIKDKIEIIIAINSDAIEKAKVRDDLGITYDQDVLRLIDSFRSFDLYVGSVCLTQFNNQPLAKLFEKKLQKQGIKTYHHYPINNYPNDVENIVSDSGLGKNDYIQTSRPLVVVTAPGPGSGKMATCISQLYHDNKHGIKSGYAKFETFPIWNLPLKHPLNLAYEAATIDLDDVNMIDPFYLEAYNKIAVNYNRDVEIFPVLDKMFIKIYGHSIYKSPTDMGVNMIGECISDDEVCKEASKQEIIRRYYKVLYQFKKSEIPETLVNKMELLMSSNNILTSDRKCVLPCLDKANKTHSPAAAIELNDGSIITGKTSSLLGATSAMIINALKHLAGIDDKIDLISENIIQPISKLKINDLGSKNPRLHVEEVLIALSISAITNPIAQLALDQIPQLKKCQVHSSVILSFADLTTLKKLGINVTTEPVYETNALFHR